MSKRNKNELTVTAHFAELRNKIIVCALMYAILFILCYVKSDVFLKYVMDTGKRAGFTLGYVAPQEVLIQAIRLSGTVALLLSLPIFSIEILLFIVPAIDSKSAKRVLIMCTIIAYALFLIGFVFCQTGLLPMVYQYLFEYANKLGAADYVSLENYLSLLLSTTWIIGLAFELPLLTAGLSRIGILTAKRMKEFFKPATIIIFIISALITPPDVVSMLIVAGPLEIVYTISIVVCRIFTNNRINSRRGSINGKTY